MDIERLPFMGQLRGHRLGAAATISFTEEVNAARNSLYFWWWRFLKESDEYQRAEAGDLKEDPWASVAADFGNPRSEFDTWWYVTGRNLFSERVRVPKVRRMDQGETALYDLQQSLFVEIPLTVRRKTILRQVNRMLDRYHAGHDLRVYSHSTAKRTIYPHQRIRMTTFPILLAVWYAAKEAPDKPSWQIGEELGLSPVHVVKDKDPEGVVRNKRRMMSLTVQRLLRKARALIDFAARGDFPRFK